MLESPTLLVDPKSNTASGILTFRNNAKAPTKLSLTASSFVIGERALATKCLFSTAGTSPGKSVYEFEIAAEKNADVDISVSNLWDAGESQAVLKSNGKPIGTLRAIKHPVPFGAKIAFANGEVPNISFVSGTKIRIGIKNEDLMTYPVSWELAITGIQAQPVSASNLVLPPGETSTIEFLSPSAWSPSFFSGMFKDRVRDGLLTLRYTPETKSQDAQVLVKTLAFKAHLSNWSPSSQSFFQSILIFVMLLAGGVCSLMLSQYLPNQLKRLDLQEQLSQLAEKTRGLSANLDSSLRVVTRVQRMRLSSLLRSRWIMSPDMVTVFSQCSQGMATLNKQVELLDTIDSMLDRLSERKSAPPSLLCEIESNLDRASNLLNSPAPTQADFQSAQEFILIAEAKLSFISANTSDRVEDKDFASKWTERAVYLRDLFQEGKPIYKYPNYDKIRKELELPFGMLTRQKDDLRPSEYQQLDIQLTKLELIASYLIAANEKSGQACASKAVGRVDDFIGYLGNDNPSSLNEARNLVLQIQDGVFEDDITEAIAANRLMIVVDPPLASTNWPMRLRVEFFSQKLNTATAKQQFQCIWTFEYPIEKDKNENNDSQTERGWMVYHYFTKPLTYHVSVEFRDKNGEIVKGKAGIAQPQLGRDLKVQPSVSASLKDRFYTELIRLAIVLVIALFALMAGAIKPLLEMEIIPAMIAIFSMGFGADTIKNLLAPAK